MSIFDQLRTEQFQQVIDQANAAQLRVLWQAEKAKVVQLKELVRELESDLDNINYRLRLDYPRENAEIAADAINDAVRHIREFHGLLATEYRCAKVLDLIEQYASQVRG